MTSFVVCVDCQLFVKVIDLGINNNYQPYLSVRAPIPPHTA